MKIPRKQFLQALSVVAATGATLVRLTCEGTRLDLTSAVSASGTWAQSRVVGIEDPFKEPRVVPIQAIQRSVVRSDEPLTITDKLVLKDKTVTTHLPSFHLEAAGIPVDSPEPDSVLVTCDASTLAQCMASSNKSVNRIEKLGSRLAESIRLMSDGKRFRAESTDSVRYGGVYVGGQVEGSGEVILPAKASLPLIKALTGLVLVSRSDNAVHLYQKDGLADLRITQLSLNYPDTDSQLLAVTGLVLTSIDTEPMLQALVLMSAISGRDRDLQLTCDGKQLHMAVVDTLEATTQLHQSDSAKAETVVPVLGTPPPWKLKVRLSDLTLATTAMCDMGASSLTVESIWEGGAMRLHETNGNGSCQMFGTLEA